MPKSDYLQANDDAFNLQLQTFKNNIPNYATVLSLSSGQLAPQTADAAYFDYLLKCRRIMADAAQQWSAWKDLVRDGGSPPAAGAPVAPTLPTAVTAVAPGIEDRFRALVKLIKANGNYNPAMGQALGIEGSQQTAPDLNTLQPQIDAMLTGNHVNVKWGWGGNRAFLKMIEIQVDRSDTHGFQLLTMDTTPGYTDTQAIPATPVKWTYRAIYHDANGPVGQWSAPVSLTVGA